MAKKTPDVAQDEPREHLYAEIILSMATSYLKVLKERYNEPPAPVSLNGIESALNTAMPYIKKQLADKVRAQKRGINDWNDDVREQVAQLIERFEL